MATPDRDFDLVLWGATGFTGRLTAEYLLRTYGTDTFRWAIGGRSGSKLDEVRQGLARDTGVDPSGLEVVLGDARDAASMATLAERTRVVCTTVGPYALYGSELVAACARAGTHYCDLTGELPWMRHMIDAHQDEAAASGARIVHTCGFDCIPADLGVWFLQREFKARYGVASPRVKLRVVGFRGGGSGGTAATALNMLDEASRDPEIGRLEADPYALNPKGQASGPDGPDRNLALWDADFEQWTGPFVIGPLDSQVVRRTNALTGYAYGTDFRYDEAMLMGAGPAGFAKAAGLAAGLTAAMAALTLGPVRRLAAFGMPKPGQGPGRATRESGYWDVRLHAAHPTDPAKSLGAHLTGDRDPGYGSTAKMLGESAVCLALDPLASPGGFLTPAAAMGDPLLARLQQKAGVTAEIETERA